MIRLYGPPHPCYPCQKINNELTANLSLRKLADTAALAGCDKYGIFRRSPEAELFLGRGETRRRGDISDESRCG